MPAHFGQIESGLATPAQNDSRHDILLAVIEWAEKGVAPESLVGTKFVDDQPAKGVQKQRTYCVYPEKSVLMKGADSKKAESWKCV